MAATKKQFLNTKNFMPNIKSRVVPAILRGGGTVAMAVIDKKVGEKVFSASLLPYKGATIFGLGIIAEALFEDEKVRAIAQGVQAYGALNLGGQIMGKESVGLSGTEETAPNTAAMLAAPDYDSMLAEDYNNEVAANEVENPEMLGLG